jgi:hypothetical protein
MKGAKFLIALLVVLVLVGFLVISGYSFWLTLTVKGNVQLSEPLSYLANALTALVGGIVTYGFGLSPKPTSERDDTILRRSARGLGALVLTGETAQALTAQTAPKHGYLGFFYALFYILVGVAAIVVWVVDDYPPELVKNLATVFLGMVLPVVTSFFRENA